MKQDKTTSEPTGEFWTVGNPVGDGVRLAWYELCDYFDHLEIALGLDLRVVCRQEGDEGVFVCCADDLAVEAIELLLDLKNEPDECQCEIRMLEFIRSHNPTPPIDDETIYTASIPFAISEAASIGGMFECITQDPDVLDTWFSSALWPMSTLGWPEDTAELQTWNPSNVLCTAREIITLWVSRMVMFNTYLHGKLPFTDVFIHAMIQDGHGQKMSKSLGNGVDPNDIIHSHGSDAMRFTLTSMTTQTQDVRMPVDMVCPHTQKMFTPKFVITGAHQSKVAAPVQDSPFAKGKQMVSSFGLATGQAKPSDDVPLARNTSEKFDYGRNFANKLWNATRFALSKLEEASDAEGAPNLPMGLADRWILSRTARTIEEVNAALENYDFHNYAGRLYQFVWNDVCDWYIEAVKPTIGATGGGAGGARSRQVLAVVLDVSLRMLHPAMPFITERLWESLSAVAPKRGVRGLDPTENELLVTADWPVVDRALVDLQAEENFERLRTLVTMIREVRTANKVPPREKVEVSVKIAEELVGLIGPQQGLIESLANVKVVAVGPGLEKPDDAAVIVRPLAEVFLHNQLDADAEKTRLTKHLAEVAGQVKNLEGRLSNEKYTRKAPAHLVQESRDKLAGLVRERDAVQKQLAELG